MKIFCIIPAYNEAATIAQVVEKVKLITNEIIVVDDGSRDETKKLAKEKGAVVLSHIINRGQGAALETGNQYALNKGADIIVHFDADGQFLAEEIKDIILPIIKGEANIVFGSRFLGKKSNLPRFKKYIIIPLAHLVNKIFIGATLTDPQNGFRAMSSETAKKITIEQNGMAHNTEIISKSFENNLKIKEIPVTVIYHNFGQRFSGGLKIIKDLILSRLIN
jgi:glycosyltransferase involved in cell wall biosynthesis